MSCFRHTILITLHKDNNNNNNNNNNNRSNKTGSETDSFASILFHLYFIHFYEDNQLWGGQMGVGFRYKKQYSTDCTTVSGAPALLAGKR